jgi:tRNA-Thr(GGU) m(6)t(6)A37 methyltransferase TsaA
MTIPCPLTVIGVVRSARSETEATPVQSSLNRGEEAVVEIAEPFVEGLAGLEDFDYAWLFSWLDRSDERGLGPPPLRQVPFLMRRQNRAIGLFAMRGPRRVNPIGLSLVRVLGVSGSTVRFAGVDLVDGTPVVDIKPYVTRFDLPPGEPRCGWFDAVEMTEGVTPSDLGPNSR